MRNHTTDGLVEDSGWGTEMERTSTGWVVSGHLSEVGVVLELRTEELSRDVQGLTSYNDDLLAVEQLLCNSACKSTKKVTLGIDRDDWLEGRHRVLRYLNEGGVVGRFS